MILSSVAMLITSWWYARRVPISAITMLWRESSQEARGLIVLGMSFMGAGLVASATGYAIQALLIRQFGLAESGIYQAAYSLSGALVGFVLNAMAADYYPRLTAVANDNDKVHRMINEQTQISILLALPGLAAMMIFAPMIIKIFTHQLLQLRCRFCAGVYSVSLAESFHGHSAMLCWQKVVGDFFL